jgi:hypothetical protein
MQFCGGLRAWFELRPTVDDNKDVSPDLQEQHGLHRRRYLQHPGVRVVRLLPVGTGGKRSCRWSTGPIAFIDRTRLSGGLAVGLPGPEPRGDRCRESAEIFEAGGDDGFENAGIDGLIVVDRDVAEADHLAETTREPWIDHTLPLEERERFGDPVGSP